MTQTIEEAAERFAEMKTTKQAGSSVERDKKALLMTQFFHFALEELPLSERLTAKEKERINKAYAYAITHIEFDENRAEVRLLHRIFGADFFKEERE